MREKNLKKLVGKGFQVSQSLPLPKQRKTIGKRLRPLKEIGQRLMSLDALFIWVSERPEDVASNRVEAYVNNNHLKSIMTKEERNILSTNRDKANKEYDSIMGWKLENMWVLAWILGFKPAPKIDSGTITVEIAHKIFLDFLPGLEKSVNDLLRNKKPKSKNEIIEMEALYYCAHNAVVSARLGYDTVPKGFDYNMKGEAIIQRRHALSLGYITRNILG